MRAAKLRMEEVMILGGYTIRELPKWERELWFQDQDYGFSLLEETPRYEAGKPRDYRVGFGITPADAIKNYKIRHCNKGAL